LEPVDFDRFFRLRTLSGRQPKENAPLSRFRGVDSTLKEHLSAFQGVARLRYPEYSGRIAIEVMRFLELGYLAGNPLKRR
jgi:hypothetical protein